MRTIRVRCYICRQRFVGKTVLHLETFFDRKEHLICSDCFKERKAIVDVNRAEIEQLLTTEFYEYGPLVVEYEEGTSKVAAFYLDQGRLIPVPRKNIDSSFFLETIGRYYVDGIAEATDGEKADRLRVAIRSLRVALWHLTGKME